MPRLGTDVGCGWGCIAFSPGGQMQGSMKTHRSTIKTGTVALATSLAIAALAPLAADAGPLLSGYGGPGQGNQAILGSTLIGGRGGGGSSGGGGQVAASSGVAGSGRESLAASAGGSAGSAAALSTSASPARRSGSPASRSTTRSGSASGSLAGELSARAYHGLQRSAGTSPAFGLSGADIAYIVLAAAAVAFTGVLTRRMARTSAAKGH